MKVRRDVPATPKQTAAAAWRSIVALISDDTSTDADQLTAAAGVMETLIADEVPQQKPIAVAGESLRVVLYCLYGDTALDADTELDKLPGNPTKGDWVLYAPCEAEDVEWMNQALSENGDRVRVFDVETDCPVDTEDKGMKKKGTVTIDWEALKSA